MNNQMTLLALGAKCALPSGGSHAACASAFITPSRCNIEPRTSPVNPMPQSARKTRRLTRPHGLHWSVSRLFSLIGTPSRNVEGRGTITPLKSPLVQGGQCSQTVRPLSGGTPLFGVLPYRYKVVVIKQY